jgi:hypothetical protein
MNTSKTNTTRTFLITIIAATAASTLPCLVGCGGSPEDDAEAEAQADTAAAAAFEQYGTHSYPAQSADGASAATPASPDAHNTSKCTAARPPKNATLNYHGGPLLSHAKVYNIGYGVVKDGSTFNAFTKWLVESSYVTDLGEYGIGGATFEEGFQGASTTTKTVTDSQIQGFLARLVNARRLPRDAQSLFMVYTAPGVTVVNNHDHNLTSCKDICGYHGAFGYRPDPSGGVLTVNYSVIPDLGGCADACWVGSNLGDREKTVSHELAEALTDSGGHTWFDNANGQEIGDLCNSAFYTTTHGYITQCEWSNRHGGCVNNTP